MDLERTMEFIVEQQAQLTASVQKHDEQIAKNSEQIAALSDLVGRLAQAEIRLVERMDKSESSLRERMEKSESSQQEMRTAMARLFERMDRFIHGLEGDGHKRD